MERKKKQKHELKRKSEHAGTELAMQQKERRRSNKSTEISQILKEDVYQERDTKLKDKWPIGYCWTYLSG